MKGGSVLLNLLILLFFTLYNKQASLILAEKVWRGYWRRVAATHNYTIRLNYFWNRTLVWCRLCVIGLNWKVWQLILVLLQRYYLVDYETSTAGIIPFFVNAGKGRERDELESLFSLFLIQLCSVSGTILLFKDCWSSFLPQVMCPESGLARVWISGLHIAIKGHGLFGHPRGSKDFPYKYNDVKSEKNASNSRNLLTL